MKAIKQALNKNVEYVINGKVNVVTEKTARLLDAVRKEAIEVYENLQDEITRLLEEIATLRKEKADLLNSCKALLNAVELITLAQKTNKPVISSEYKDLIGVVTSVKIIVAKAEKSQ